MILFGRPDSRFAGAVVGLAGLLGAVRWFGEAARVWQERVAAQRRARRTATVRAARRQRTRMERQRLQSLRQSRRRAKQKELQRREEQRAAAVQAAAEGRARRARGEQAAALEAERLRSLNDADLFAALIPLFARRGYRVESADPGRADAIWDLRLFGPDGRLSAVARQTPVGHVARPTDVSALEAWRQDCGAQGAYLVALAGFTPEAIECACRTSVQLVEAELLASWQEAGFAPQAEACDR